MRGGDISNESPPSVIVNLDVVLNPVIEIDKVMGMFPRTKRTHAVDMLAANAVDRVASQSSFTWEAFTTELDEDQTAWVTDELDRLGVNPFRWIIVVDSIASLLADLPYRRNVLGIIDRPERALMYGSHYIDFTTIYGGQ